MARVSPAFYVNVPAVEVVPAVVYSGFLVKGDGMRFAKTIFCLMLVLGLVPVAGSAQESKPLREPDVIFVPTPQAVVDAMLKMAGVHKGDVVYDLGSGDGRIVVTAAREYGVKGIGIDINPKSQSQENRRSQCQRPAGRGDQPGYVLQGGSVRSRHSRSVGSDSVPSDVAQPQAEAQAVARPETRHAGGFADL